MMSRVEKLESEVQRMTAVELAEFRAWFAEFDAESWDREIEMDVAAGKLSGLADRALLDLEHGRTTPL